GDALSNGLAAGSGATGGDGSNGSDVGALAGGSAPALPVPALPAPVIAATVAAKTTAARETSANLGVPVAVRDSVAPATGGSSEQTSAGGHLSSMRASAQA